MTLSREAITSFQKLYQIKFGVWLSGEDAQIKALEELKQFALIYKPIKTEDLKVFNKFNSEKNNE